MASAIVIAVGFVVFVVSNMVKMRARMRDVPALQEMRTIMQAQRQYRSRFGEYAGDLSQLGAKPIPGWTFKVEKTATGFAVRATPVVFGKDGRRAFYLDERGIVRVSRGPEPATAESPEIK